MASVMDPVSRTGENRETGWVNRLFTKEGSTPEYQELKFTLHRKLLDRINLEALSSMSSERVRAEVRTAVARLVEEEKTPLSLVKRTASSKRSWTKCSASAPSNRCCKTPPLVTSW